MRAARTDGKVWLDERVNRVVEADGERLYGLLRRLTLRGDVAEDLLHDLFVRLAEGDVGGVADLPAYARRVAINLAMDWRRRTARRRETGIDRAAGMADGGPGAPDGVERAEEWERVLQAVAELGETVREVVVRRFVLEEEYEAIGRSAGRSAHQVRGLCHAGLRQLRRALEVDRERK